MRVTHRRWCIAALACLATLGLGLPLVAPAELVDGPDGAVNAIARGADGTTYLGGFFRIWGSYKGGFSAVDNTDGAVNRAFPLVPGWVFATVPDGHGGWYIGGNFSSVGGLPRQGLAHIDATGAVTDWAPAINDPFRHSVFALALDADTLYVGGRFTDITPPGGPAIPRANLAAIRITDNGSVTDWAPATNGSVYTLALSGNTLFAGGDFTSVTLLDWFEFPRGGLAAIRTDDFGSLTAWAPRVEGDFGPYAYVRSMVLSGTTLYFGGAFSRIVPPGGSAIPRGNLAAIRITDTGSVTDWAPVADDRVEILAARGSTLYAGGWFSSITPPGGSPTPRGHLAALRTDDNGTLTDWAPDSNGPIFALAVGDDTLYAGGYFSGITPPGGGEVRRGNLAGISLTDNGSLTDWAPAVDADVNALALQGRTVVIGGSFFVTGRRRDSLAALDASGHLTAWAPAVDESVGALAISGNTLYVGGRFTSVAPPNGSWTGRASLAAIRTDDVGTLTDWAPAANASINAMAISGNTLYVGGDFTSMTPPGGSPTPRSRLAAINMTDTGSLTDWAPGANGEVHALAIDGTTLYAGGDFTSITPAGGSPTPRNRLAAIRTTGTGGLTGWAPGASQAVRALALDGATLYAGGDFVHITPLGGSPTPRNRLAAIRTSDGGSLTSWAPSANGRVSALLLSGTTLYAGGQFNAITPAGGSAVTRNLLAAISVADNGGVMNWNPNPKSPGYGESVDALAADDDTVIAGGYFFLITNELQPNSPTSWLSFLTALPCSSGTALRPGTWQQPALPCLPEASPATVTATLGTAPAANLPAAGYGSQWVVNQRPVTATGWSRLAADGLLSQGAGYALRSNVAAVGNVLAFAGTPTPVVTGDPDCPSVNGCFIATLTSGSGPLGDKLLGNPFPYDLDWADVRVRDGLNLYTPGEAQAAGLMANQAWVWNGSAYDTFADVAPVRGRLRYGQAFWVRLLPGATGRTLELLLPARQAGPAALAPVAGDWRVRLTLRHATTGTSTEAHIGQWTGAEDGRDALDLMAMTPYAAPWLSLTVPHPEWGSARGDYATDFRARGATGATWPISLRADRPGTSVVLTWDGEPSVLANSRLVDGGNLIDLADYPNGYPLTLTGKVKQLTWEYLGSN